MKKKIFILSSIFFILFYIYSNAEPSKVMIRVRNFRNRSNYSGKWNISSGISNMLRESLPVNYYQKSRDSAEYIVNGIIKEFTLASKGLASYGLGGYQDFSAKVTLKIILSRPGGKPLLRYNAKGNIIRQDLGFTILGGPVGDDRYRNALKRLWNLDFDSKEFRNSILGQAIYDAIYQAIPRISMVILKQPYGLRGEVVRVRGDSVYMDIGKENHLSIGQELNIYALETPLFHPRKGKLLGKIPETLIGRLKVSKIIGSQLSVGEIIEGQGKIEKNDIVVLE